MTPFNAPMGSTAVVRDVGAVIARSLLGRATVDRWGVDAHVVDAWAAVTRLRYDILIEGASNLPETPFLVVANRRAGFAEPSVLAAAVHGVTGRPVRLTGLVDRPLVSTVARRAGAVLSDAAEIGSLLRAGENVAVFADRHLRHSARAGPVPADLIAPAVAKDCSVVPVALLGRELGRRWVVRIGAPLDPPVHHGPLAVTEHAHRARIAVQDLLDG